MKKPPEGGSFMWQNDDLRLNDVPYVIYVLTKLITWLAIFYIEIQRLALVGQLFLAIFAANEIKVASHFDARLYVDRWPICGASHYALRYARSRLILVKGIHGFAIATGHDAVVNLHKVGWRCSYIWGGWASAQGNCKTNASQHFPLKVHIFSFNRLISYQDQPR